MSKQTIIINHLEAIQDSMFEEWDFQVLHMDIAIIRERCARVYNHQFPPERKTYIDTLNI